MVTFFVSNFALEAKGHGVPKVMDAIYYREGVIRPVVALVKSLASAVAMGSGSSVGREGPIIQIGSALGSTLGQILPRYRPIGVDFWAVLDPLPGQFDRELVFFCIELPQDVRGQKVIKVAHSPAMTCTSSKGDAQRDLRRVVEGGSGKGQGACACLQH